MLLKALPLGRSIWRKEQTKKTTTLAQSYISSIRNKLHPLFPVSTIRIKNLQHGFLQAEGRHTAAAALQAMLGSLSWAQPQSPSPVPKISFAAPGAQPTPSHEQAAGESDQISHQALNTQNSPWASHKAQGNNKPAPFEWELTVHKDACSRQHLHHSDLFGFSGHLGERGVTGHKIPPQLDPRQQPLRKHC